MLDGLFLSVLNMSIMASFVILVVLPVRILLKKALEIFSYALWAVVLFRFLCPISFESAVGLLPINKTPIPQNILYSTTPQIDTGLSIIDNAVNPILPIPINMGESINPLQLWTFVGSAIWAIGMLAMLLYSIIQFLILKGKLIGATPLRDNIYLADHISSPFVMGVIKPHIYLPSSMAETEQVFIIEHEQHHIKRFDHIARILGFIALSIHWFNPFAWLAFVLSGKDMEMSCDEAVMKRMGADIRAEYSQSLLRFATGRKFIAATPLAFGEGDTKDRVKNVMRYKKPILWVSIISVIAVVCVGLGLMSNSISEPVSTQTENISMVQLWKNRTEYVGDNSAVGNIISGLNFPEKLRYNGFQLDTEQQPYGITVNFKTDTETGNLYTGELNQAPLEQNAIIMFSLIENADVIHFNLDDGKNPYSESFYRESAQAIMEQENLFAKTETVESLNTFIKEVEKRLSRSGNSNGYENQGISDFKGVELYVWKNEIDETYFTLLSGTNRNKTEDEIYNKRIATTDIKKIANTLLKFDDGLHLFIIQMNETDFTKDEIVAYEQEIISHIGENIKDYNVSIGLFKPAKGKDISTDDAQYNTEAEFLNHPEGMKFQSTAYKAAKSYLSGDIDELQQYATENLMIDTTHDLFKDVDYIILKWSLDDMKAKDKIKAAYEFRIKEEDTVSYVSMDLIKIDAEWKVDTIGIEK